MVHGAWLPRLNWTSGVIRLSNWRASLLRPATTGTAARMHCGGFCLSAPVDNLPPRLKAACYVGAYIGSKQSPGQSPKSLATY